MEHASDTTKSVVRWRPPRGEWEPDPQKPFIIQVLKKAVFSGIVDTEFVIHFKNSLAIMCEVWLKRRGIDPTINTSRNFHKLQDEFLKVLAHINRGFETEVNAEWKTGVGKLLEISKQIEKEADPQWIDHEQERRGGDRASRYELKEEPRQDIADNFWVTMFKGGLRWKEKTLGMATRIDAQQSKFFLASFAVEEQKTFTETKITLLNNTQDEWIQNSLSAKLGLRRGYDFLEETFAPSIREMREAKNVITEGNAKLWLINNFFQLQKRDWNYLLGTLTGGHVALERLFGCIIATLLIGHGRKAFELKEDEAEELFNLFSGNALTLPFKKSEDVLRALHQSVTNAEEYRIFHEAAALVHALEISDTCGSRFKSFPEAKPVIQALEPLVRKVSEYPVYEPEQESPVVEFPVLEDKTYGRLLLKLESLLKMEVEIHKVVESVFWNVVETFSDFLRAHKIQSKKKLAPPEREEIKAIANKYHLRPDESNFLMYAPDRCYLGTELCQARSSGKDARKKSTEIHFQAKTQKVRKNYLTPPAGIRRDLSAACGRYGKLVGNVRDKSGKTIVRNIKMIWNPPKIQITDLRHQTAILPFSQYEITVTRAEPRKPREKWE